MASSRHNGQNARIPATAAGSSDADQDQAGEFLTTAQGLRLPDTDHSLKAGERGPTLLEDFHLREKITHFDHERIPERVVHARGAAAHGIFESYGTGRSVTKAGFLASKGRQTEVFVRFSTVLGSRGSADTVRDTRGFAVKFYTPEGTFDLVGNNMPVFFIQDGIKFPDVIHAAKPHPDREIPQAQSAHDTFWDFASLHTEATHHVMWNMSDRGIPRSYRTMEGFGVHTFRLVNEAGETHLVKFHWKPAAGVHSLVWEEAQITAGVDPDFHRRDMADGIEAGAFLEYELGIQVMPDDGTDSFEGIDLLDPTKLIPEELAPVQLIGKLTLNRNPANYFAETEQVAFHTGNLVPGIEVTNDPLLQARLFSYLDTQLTRLGGPNFTQLPVNRPHCPVNDMLRDGMHQTAAPVGLAPYRPNSIDGGEPLVATADEGGYVQVPRPVEGTVIRSSPVSFSDHFSQPAMFYRSLTPLEQAHIAEAFTFELGKCYEQAIKERELQVLANVDADLCAQVAAGLGLPAPGGRPAAEATLSPALSQVVTKPGPIAGRKIGIIADAGADLAGISKVRTAAARLGATALVIAPVGGVLGSGAHTQPVDRTLLTTRSVEFDALVVAGGTTPSGDIKLTLLLQEAFRHCKVLAAWGDGIAVLEAAGITAGAVGVVTGDAAVKSFTGQLAAAVGLHRAWDRAPAVMASAVPRSLRPEDPAHWRQRMTDHPEHDPLGDLAAAGVAVWLDDLSRELLADGGLQSLVATRHVVGVTTNPTIFASALSRGDRYNDQLAALAACNADVDTAVLAVTTDDVRAACDALAPVHAQTAGLDGRVSIEVDPRLSRDAAATTEMARRLRTTVNRDNLYIKIPATQEGLAAITEVISQGISVNVTLIFSLERYRAVMDAYLSGLEQAHAAGRDLTSIRSVASFFISRVDAEVDARLDHLGTPEAAVLKGSAAIANARLAYQAHEQLTASERWQRLARLGARPQRPLWASTGVKNPAYPDTKYVAGLIARGTVNTMPGPTLEAFADHGQVSGDTMPGGYDGSRSLLDQLAKAGIDFNDVTEYLERDGLAKFEKSWSELGATVAAELERHHPTRGPAGRHSPPPPSEHT